MVVKATPEDIRLQMCVAEASWERDAAAMLHTIDRLARRARLTVPETILKHVSEFKYGWRPHRRWIPHLTAACTKPEGFRGEWDGAYQHRCFALVNKIRQHAAGKLADPCKGKPNQWRARGKASRLARKKGWKQIGCGRRSLHTYWERP